MSARFLIVSINQGFLLQSFSQLLQKWVELMSTPISDIFGWHCPCASQFEDEKIAKGCLTVLNIAGYIPVVGTISGIVRN